MFSLESPQRGDSNEYTEYTISQYKKENHPQLFQICIYGICFKGPKNEFETAVVNQPPVFQPLKFYCIDICREIQNTKSISSKKYRFLSDVSFLALSSSSCRDVSILPCSAGSTVDVDMSLACSMDGISMSSIMAAWAEEQNKC